MHHQKSKLNIAFDFILKIGYNSGVFAICAGCALDARADNQQKIRRNKCVKNTVFAVHDDDHDVNSCFDIPAHTNIFDTLKTYDCFNDYVEYCDIIDRVTQSSSVKCDNSDSANGKHGKCECSR